MMAEPLRAVRQAQDRMTQMDLAVKSGVSISTIVNIENNRQIPSVHLARKIADALGVSVYDIAWPTEDQLVSRRPKGETVAA